MSKWEHTRHCLHAQPRKAHSVPRSPQDKRPDRLTVDTGRYEQTSIHTQCCGIDRILPMDISRRSMWQQRLPLNSPIRTQIRDRGRVRAQHEASPWRTMPLPDFAFSTGLQATNTSNEERCFSVSVQHSVSNGRSAKFCVAKVRHCASLADDDDQLAVRMEGGRRSGRINRPRQ